MLGDLGIDRIAPTNIDPEAISLERSQETLLSPVNNGRLRRYLLHTAPSGDSVHFLNQSLGLHGSLHIRSVTEQVLRWIPEGSSGHSLSGCQ
jgi:hypothetical protein